MLLKAAARAVLTENARRRVSIGRRVFRATRKPSMVLASQRLLGLSAKAFGGWFTRHSTRWWEYPWVEYQVAARAKSVSPKVADFGAGKSPIPLALSNLGLECTVVDPGQLEGLEGKPRGNEWDFIDYERWGVRTIRAGMQDEVFALGSLGFAVSVSVIEHLTADMRRTALERLSTALEAGGYAIVTLDLLPGSRNLWNKVVEEIEPVEVHGTLDDFLAEAARAHLWVEHLEWCPIKTPLIDVVGIVFRKNGKRFRPVASRDGGLT